MSSPCRLRAPASETKRPAGVVRSSGRISAILQFADARHRAAAARPGPAAPGRVAAQRGHRRRRPNTLSLRCVATCSRTWPPGARSTRWPRAARSCACLGPLGRVRPPPVAPSRRATAKVLKEARCASSASTPGGLKAGAHCPAALRNVARSERSVLAVACARRPDMGFRCATGFVRRRGRRGVRCSAAWHGRQAGPGFEFGGACAGRLAATLVPAGACSLDRPQGFLLAGVLVAGSGRLRSSAAWFGEGRIAVWRPMRRTARDASTRVFMSIAPSIDRLPAVRC